MPFRDAGARAVRALRDVTPFALAVAGVAAALAGVADWSPAAAKVLAGVVAIAFAWKLERAWAG